jgi:hypothetical protein
MIASELNQIAESPGRSGRVADDSGITLPCGYLRVYRYRLKRGAD